MQCLMSPSGYLVERSSLSWKVKLQRKEKEFQKIPVPIDYRPMIDGPPADWKCFFRQEEAFAFARSKAESLHVFAYESERFEAQHGQRLYLVASLPHFHHYYSQLSPEKRHHYEVIPNGSVCRLYFDLEFSTSANCGKQGVRMTAVFIKYICGWLQKCFNLTCTSSDVLQLDASTAEKFSRHLIFHLPNAVFQDNIQAGHFVHHCVRAIWDLNSSTCHLSASNEDGKNSSPNERYCAQDQPSALQEIQNTKTTNTPQQQTQNASESTSKENIEDGDSGKNGQQNKMRLTKDDLKAWDLTKNDVLDLIVNDKHGKPTLFCDTAVYTKNRNFRLYLSCKLGKRNPLLLAEENQYKPSAPDSKLEKQYFMDSLVTNIEFTNSARILRFEGDSREKGSSMRTGSSKDEGGLQGYNVSPYPELDAFITSQVQSGGVAGFIRHWAYFPQAEVMLYDIGRNRWCHNIGRPHRSNNIMMVADLKAAMFYQKCHDPDCRAIGYKSPEMPIPKAVLPSHYMDEAMDEEMQDGDDFMDDMTDEALVDAATFLEQSVEEKSDIDTSATEDKCKNPSKKSDAIDSTENSDAKTEREFTAISFDEEIGDEELLETTDSFMEQSRIGESESEKRDCEEAREESENNRTDSALGDVFSEEDIADEELVQTAVNFEQSVHEGMCGSVDGQDEEDVRDEELLQMSECVQSEEDGEDGEDEEDEALWQATEEAETSINKSILQTF